MLKLIIVLFALIQGGICQNCRSDWNSLVSCMKDRYNDYSAQLRLSDNDRANVEQKIRDCYTQQQCQDPFPPPSVANAAKSCYFDIQARVQQDMQTCMQKEFKDFDMPEDDALAYLWMQDEVYVKAAEDDSKICGAYTNQNNLNICVSKAIEDAFTNPKQTQDMCDVRRQCSQQLSQTCLVRWREKIQPKLCTCASDQKKTNGYKMQYKSCIESKQSTLSDLDAYGKFLDNSKARLCNTKKDPCAGDSLNRTSGTTTQNPISALFGGQGGGSNIGGIGGGSNTGNSAATTNFLGNLARLVMGSGGSVQGGSSVNGGNSAGSNSGASVPNVGISSLTNIFNTLTGGTNPFASLTSGSNANNGLTGLTNILTGGNSNILTGGNPMSSLKKALSDTTNFGSLKGDGGYGSLLGGRGTSYDFDGKRK